MVPLNIQMFSRVAFCALAALHLAPSRGPRYEKRRERTHNTKTLWGQALPPVAVHRTPKSEITHSAGDMRAMRFPLDDS